MMSETKTIECPNCGSHNVTVTLVQQSAKTKKHHNSMIRSLGRGLMIVCTLGLWWLFTGKGSGTNKTKIRSQKQAICQNCGYSWKVK